MQGLMLTETNLEAAEKGIKTVTRRLVNPQPPEDGGKIIHVSGREWRWEKDKDYCTTQATIKSRLQADEIIFIQEPYLVWNGVRAKRQIIYKAIEPDFHLGVMGKNQWNNKMFMPAKFARLFAIIKSVRPEKLGDITTEEIRLEGIECHFGFVSKGTALYRKSMWDQWIALWESIHGRNSWDHNKDKWVWRYEFQIVPTGIFRKVVRDDGK